MNYKLKATVERIQDAREDVLGAKDEIVEERLIYVINLLWIQKNQLQSI